jgi:5-methylthioadenosine/S-adenosylhomocysteine deaminase
VVGDDQGVVLSGLVNAHTHLSEGLLCGMGEDLSLLEWLAAIIALTARHLTREMARVGPCSSAPSCCCRGSPASTTCSATPTRLAGQPGAVDGLEAMGLRGVVAFGADDADDPWPVASVLAEHHALAERCAASNLVGFRLGVGTVLGQHDGLLVASAAEARANGWAVHTHLAEVKEEVVEARLR